MCPAPFKFHHEKDLPTPKDCQIFNIFIVWGQEYIYLYICGFFFKKFTAQGNYFDT